MAAYHRAEEFSHFGSNLSKDSAIDLKLGQQIYAVLQQGPEELYSLTQQQLMLETIILNNAQVDLDIDGIKKAVKEIKKTISDEKEFDKLEADLLKKYSKTIKETVVDTPPQETSDATS